IAEPARHRGPVLGYTPEPPAVLQYPGYLAAIKASYHAHLGGRPGLHTPTSYAATQDAARRWHRAGSDGIVYNSVRREGGQCVAAFYPDLVSPALQGPHLHYHWDGERITHYSVVNEIVQL